MSPYIAMKHGFIMELPVALRDARYGSKYHSYIKDSSQLVPGLEAQQQLSSAGQRLKAFPLNVDTGNLSNFDRKTMCPTF